MIKTEEKNIDGVNYAVTQFPARRALKVQTKLMKLLAPTLLAASARENTSQESILDKDISSPEIQNALTALMSKLDEDYVVNLILELLMCTRREGKEITEGLFDTVYAGNFKELYKALLFVLEVNYGSFLKELGTLRGAGNLKHQP